MKPETSKTAVRQFSKKKNVDEDKGNTFTEKSLRTCLQNEVLLKSAVYGIMSGEVDRKREKES